MSKNMIVMGTVCATSGMSTRKIGDYLAKQRQNNWPGSVSIHNKPLGYVNKKGNKKETRSENEALDTGFNQ